MDRVLQRLKNSLMARNLAVPYVRMVIQLLSGLILTPVLLDHVGKESYALWALAAMILGWFGVLEMGIGGAVQRFLAGSFATGDRDGIAKQFNTGLAISCLLSAIIAGAVLACLVPVSSAMTDTTEQAAELRLLLAYLLIALVITMQTGLFATVLTARERFVPVGLVGMGVEIARLVLFLVMLLRFDASIVDLAMANAALELANLLAVALVGRLLVGLPPIGLRYLDVSRTGMMLAGFAGWSLFITVSYILRARVDLAVAKLFVGFETVAVFAVGSTLALRVEGIVSQFGGPYTSRLSRLHSLGDRKGVIEQYYRGSVVQESIAMVSGVGMIVFAPAFMRLWIGDRLATEGSQGDPLADATLVMQILAWGWFLGLYGGLIGPLMRAWNRMRVLSLLIFAEGVLNLALSLLFVLRFEWGLAGIAAGTAVAAVLVRAGVVPIIACRIMGESVWRYKLRLQVPMLLIGGVGVTVGFLAQPEDWINSWVIFFIAAAFFGSALMSATCLLPMHPVQTWRRLTIAAKQARH